MPGRLQVKNAIVMRILFLEEYVIIELQYQHITEYIRIESTSVKRFKTWCTESTDNGMATTGRVLPLRK
jgi:hypothetical protein